jgi:creatinine amidohydrolase/Fe(II)-dependent formamide hydrolase-like protein
MAAITAHRIDTKCENNARRVDALLERLFAFAAAFAITSGLLAGFVSAEPGHAPVAPPSSAEVEMARMTSIEVRDALAAGRTTVLVPTGGIEQNGRHMATGKHNIIVAEASRRIARELGDTLVAPVMPYVPQGRIWPRSGNMMWPGTVSLPDDVFEGVLAAVTESLKVQGFKTIVLIGDHGGNQEPQRRLAERLSAAWRKDGVRVVNAAHYYFDNGGTAMLKAEGETEKSLGSHAGIRDTSELMAVDPSAVRLHEAKPDSEGATGDARRATAARGERLLAMKVASAVAEIRAARNAKLAVAPEPGVISRLLHLLFG